uniref:CACTA en-spm transposon protein n=1 Tax=Cucumis melo TaxID=3656 RepID=A0A1S3BH46_CUCME
MSQAAEDVHSQPTLEGNQPLSGDEIYETMLDRRSGNSKGLGWGPKPKACKMTSASSSMTSCPQSIIELQLQAKFDQAMQQIEEQTRNHEAKERKEKALHDFFFYTKHLSPNPFALFSLAQGRTGTTFCSSSLFLCLSCPFPSSSSSSLRFINISNPFFSPSPSFAHFVSSRRVIFVCRLQSSRASPCSLLHLRIKITILCILLNEVLLKKEYGGKHFKDDLYHTFAFLNRSFRCFNKRMPLIENHIPLEKSILWVELNQTCHLFAYISCLRQKIIDMRLMLYPKKIRLENLTVGASCISEKQGTNKHNINNKNIFIKCHNLQML